MKKILLVLGMVLFVLNAFSLPWGHRYATEQPDQNMVVSTGVLFTMSVEWGEGDWQQSQIGYGTSNDGTDWTWVDIAWFEDGEGSNKRCKANITLNTPGVYYYVYKFKKNYVESHQYGSADWSEKSAWKISDIVSTITVESKSILAGDWDATDTWSGGVVPTSSANVNIFNAVTIPSDYQASCDNLVIGTGGSLTVQSDEDGTGSLIVGGTSTGNVTVQRYLTPNIYHYISSPVNLDEGGIDADGLGLDQSNAYDALFSWNETYVAGNGAWVDELHIVEYMSLTPFAGQGYVYCAGGATSGSGTAKTAEFTGSLRGDFDFSASYTNPGGKGFHLLGNPYPSTIAVNSGTSNSDYILNNHGISEIQLWDEAVTNDYVAISNASDATTIQAGQAYMTRVYSDPTTIEFRHDMCIAAAGSFYKATDPINRFYLNVTCDNGNSNQTLVAFKEGMTDGFDYSYDAEKLKGNPQIALYTKMADGTAGDYAIQALDASRLADAKVWVGLDARTDALQNDIDDGKYTFSIGNLDDFVGEVFLEDIQEGAFHNLREGSYSTSVERGYNTERFVLHFREPGGKMTTGVCQNPEAASFKVFASSGNIYTIDATGDVEVFDLAGRRVAVATMNESTNCVARNLTPGAYIVKSANGTEKVIVQ